LLTAARKLVLGEAARAFNALRLAALVEFNVVKTATIANNAKVGGTVEVEETRVEVGLAEAALVGEGIVEPVHVFASAVSDGGKADADLRSGEDAADEQSGDCGDKDGELHFVRGLRGKLRGNLLDGSSGLFEPSLYLG